MSKITKAICDSIRNNKWLYITYKHENKEKDKTYYWIGIRDFYYSKDNKRMVKCDIYNIDKGKDTLKEKSIYFDNIISATILDFTHFKTPEELTNKLDKHIEKNEFDHKRFDYNLAEMKLKYKYKN